MNTIHLYPQYYLTGLFSGEQVSHNICIRWVCCTYEPS